MRVAIIGNNDGPRRLANTLTTSEHEVVFLGLQKMDIPDEATALEKLEPLKFELLVNCFANFRYRQLHHRYAAVNVHLAPLPAYRGRHPLQWALINGERAFGATIHDIDDDYDAGVIRWQSKVDIEDGWSALQLREALLQSVEEGFPGFLDTYDPSAEGLANDTTLATYVTRRYPIDSEIVDWSDRDAVYRKITALRHDEHPAYAVVEGRNIPLTVARRGERQFVGSRPTTIVRRAGEESEVVCGDGRTLWVTGLPGHLRTNDKLL